jgi:hypothetical protein
VDAAVAQPGTPLEKITWYVEQILSSLRGLPTHAVVVTQALTSEAVPQELRDVVLHQSDRVVAVMGRLIREGQSTGEIVEGDTDQLTLLLMSLVFGLSVSAGFLPGGSVAQHDPETVMRLLRSETVMRLLRKEGSQR